MALDDRLAKQRDLLQRAERVIVGGGQGHKRPSLVPGYPIFAERGEGCRFFDADGNAYLDYLCSFGPIVLGHNYPRVTQAVQRRAELGTVFNVGAPLEVDLAERLVRLIPSAELVTYCRQDRPCLHRPRPDRPLRLSRLARLVPDRRPRCSRRRLCAHPGSALQRSRPIAGALRPVPR
jgi:hypothetical protein